jgi:hypothetical protein
MRKVDVWHVIWLLMLTVGALLLGLTLVIALYNHDSTTFANVASIWGLFVGLIGFIVTIYTLFETQRVARKAQQETQAATLEAQVKIQEAAKQAQEAVKNAQAQTRQMLERVRHDVRAMDFATLRMWVRELQSAAWLGEWPRALLFTEECPAVAERLRSAAGLEDLERKGLREGADNLRLVGKHIRTARLNTETKGLATNHAKAVEALAALLERLGGRLHHDATKDATQ